MTFADACALGLRGRMVVDTPHCNKYVYKSALLLDCLRMCHHVRGTNLEFVLQRAVNIVFPHVLKSAVEELFSREDNLIVPSKSTRHRSRLSLDVAFMLQARQQTCQPYIRFGWADSSPQFTRDWLLSAQDAIRESDLVSVAAAADVLWEERRRREVSDSRGAVFGDIELAEWLEEVAKQHTILLHGIRRHDNVPVALGRGATQLADKVSALLHAWCLECSDRPSLRRFLNSFHSFTTDMGTELGVSRFHYAGLDQESMMPEWLRKPIPDVLVDNGGDISEDDDSANPSFLPHALQVPGMLHIVFNLTKELAHALPDWEWFWEKLKMVEKLVGDRPRREVYVHFCLRGSVLAHKEADFDVGAPTLYESRWNEVHDFCCAVRVRMSTLRCTWNEDNYKRGAGGEKDKDDKQFKPQVITDAVRDPYFVAYWDMMLALGSVPKTLAGWTEGCCCHEDLLFGREDRSANEKDSPRIRSSQGC